MDVCSGLQDQIELFLKKSDSSQSGDLSLAEFVEYLQKHEKQLRYRYPAWVHCSQRPVLWIGSGFDIPPWCGLFYLFYFYILACNLQTDAVRIRLRIPLITLMRIRIRIYLMNRIRIWIFIWCGSQCGCGSGCGSRLPNDADLDPQHW